MKTSENACFHHENHLKGLFSKGQRARVGADVAIGEPLSDEAQLAGPGAVVHVIEHLKASALYLETPPWVQRSAP